MPQKGIGSFSTFDSRRTCCLAEGFKFNRKARLHWRLSWRTIPEVAADIGQQAIDRRAFHRQQEADATTEVTMERVSEYRSAEPSEPVEARASGPQ